MSFGPPPRWSVSAGGSTGYLPEQVSRTPSKFESIRGRLAPDTKTFINELDTYPADMVNPTPNIPDEYWALSASVQSYICAQLVALGIDLVGIAEIMDYAGMIPGTTLIDWENGAPNTRYQALALLLRNFTPGDSLVSTTTGMPGFPDPRIHVQGFITSGGTRKILLINKTAAPVVIAIHNDDPGRGDPVVGQMQQVSAATGAGDAATTALTDVDATPSPSTHMQRRSCRSDCDLNGEV
jgi:hypothetical protein